MHRIGIGLLWAAAGYVAGVLAGVLLVNAFSTNTFDRGMETVMTGAFATGPLLALIALVVGVVRSGRGVRP